MNENEIEQVYAGNLPEWTGSTLPNDANIIMLVNEENYDFGGTVQSAYLLSLERIAANNSLQGNTTVVISEDADIAIPNGQVVPAYVESFDPHLTKRAQATSQTTRAQFLILKRAQNVDDGYVVQSNGYYTFTEDHIYNVGQRYYLSDTAPGGVTTTAPSGAVVQPLFTVVNKRTIQIEV